MDVKDFLTGLDIDEIDELIKAVKKQPKSPQRDTLLLKLELIKESKKPQ